MRKNGVLPEIVDLLQGRIEAKNVQLGHYFKIADLKAISQQVLTVTSKIEDSLVLTKLN
jgi:intergrase/recombinase